MADLDVLIGENLSRFRGEMSQADLAKQMKSLGFKWSQATVWAVEKGERPLRLSEAAELGTILGKPMDALMLAAEERDEYEALKELVTLLELRREALKATHKTWRVLQQTTSLQVHMLGLKDRTNWPVRTRRDVDMELEHAGYLANESHAEVAAEAEKEMSADDTRYDEDEMSSRIEKSRKS